MLERDRGPRRARDSPAKGGVGRRAGVAWGFERPPYDSLSEGFPSDFNDPKELSGRGTASAGILSPRRHVSGVWEKREEKRGRGKGERRGKVRGKEEGKGGEDLSQKEAILNPSLHSNTARPGAAIPRGAGQISPIFSVETCHERVLRAHWRPLTPS